MATHGRTGVARIVLGSVSIETVLRAHLPPLLVRPAAMRHEAGELQVPSSQRTLKHERLTMLVAIDVSEKSDAALAPTAILAQAANARVILLNVFWPPARYGACDTGCQEERIEYVQRARQLYLADKARALEGLDVTTRVEVQVHGEELDECIARVASRSACRCADDREQTRFGWTRCCARKLWTGHPEAEPVHGACRTPWCGSRPLADKEHEWDRMRRAHRLLPGDSANSGRD